MNKANTLQQMNQFRCSRSIQKFTYEIENDEIDITPLLVFFAGALYSKDESRFDDDLYKIQSLQRDLAKDSIGRYFLEYIKKNERKYSYNIGPDNLFYNDEKLTSLYRNICITFFKAVQISDHLVFFNINYDFSEKVFDFLNFSFLLELYKLCLSEKEHDPKILSCVNMFFVKNSIIAFTDNVKQSVIVSEASNFLDYINQMIFYLVSPKNPKSELVQQPFFKKLVDEYPEVIHFLSVNYGEKELGEHYDKVYGDNDFLPYYKEKAKQYYEDVEFIPLISMAGLSKRIALYVFENLIRDVWFNAQIKYHMAAKNNKITELEGTIEILKRENRNLNRNYKRKTEEVEKLEKQVSDNEKDKELAVQKVQEELREVTDNIKTLQDENTCLKNKVEKQSVRIKNLSEKIELQCKILNRIPNIHEYVNSEPEIDALAENPCVTTTISNDENDVSLEKMKEAIRDKRLFFIHGIRGYEKNLETVFKRFEHVYVNEKVANFVVPQDIDGVVALVKTTPHAHIDRAMSMKQESVPFIPSTNKNIDLVIEDIYNFYFKKNKAN